MDLFGNPALRDAVSPFVQLLWELGAAHEEEIVAKIGDPFVDLSTYDALEKERLTLAAMERGEPLIYSGRISSDDLVGEPDLLQKKGNGYVAGDIKSGTGEEGATDDDDGKPKRHYAVQLALYTDILERLGYSAGRTPFVWDIHGEVIPYDLMEMRGTRNPHRLWDDYEEHLNQARNIVGQVTQTLPAYSAGTCKDCVWYSTCVKNLEETNDLTLIPELGRSKRDSLIERISSIRQLSQIRIDDYLEQGKSVFGGIGAQTLEKFHERAKLLSTEDGKPYLRRPVTLPPSDTELFFDIEVDPMRDFCYLHGFVERRGGNNETERFVSFFADIISPAEEKRAFTDAVHYMRNAQPCAIYYYSKYERTIYRKLLQKYPDVCTETELEALFDPTRSIDLYFDVVLKSTEWPTRDFSIKTLAQYLGFKWKDSHPSGAASIEWFDRWVKTRNPEIRKRILDYNEDDCRATRVLLDAIKELPTASTEQTWVGSSHFQTKILRRKTSTEEYRIYRAGLEWNLTDPIVIENREDIKSESRWRDRMTPYHHQVTNLITFCRRLPVTLLADDVGLGKTISAGLIISELISRSRLNKILIVCPKLLGPQWQVELKEKFNIVSEIAIGRELLEAEQENGAVITTYHSARSYLDSIPHDRFQMLVLDESHKLRNLYGVDEPPQVALRFRKALEERRFRFVLMLTATPIHNRLWDLYSLVDLLTVARGHKNPFGSENPPDFHVIVSTEAGSEGVNLQVANVLVNYDLPWNPMIVEQRIGRVQRLASEHANVSIFNITLRGTFEEYIVGRLMEKLQMAAHAIGDIDALLDAAGVGGEDISFDEQIRRLVVAALAGKDVRAATLQAEQSIAKAKSELEREEAAINAMLGGMDGHEYVGPRVPTLPETVRSMEPMEFTLEAFEMLGARVTQQEPDLFLIEENGGREQIRFSESGPLPRSTYYAPGTPAFSRLADRVIATGVHEIEDLDGEPAKEALAIAGRWVLSFGGKPKKAEFDNVSRCFAGTAVVRVRATVAHDSYERLVEVFCVRGQHVTHHTAQKGLQPLAHTIQNPSIVGVDLEQLVHAAKQDEAVSEFCRFYLERRAQEIEAAGDDERKRKKLEDEFTPRLEMTLVAIGGRLNRQVRMKQSYTLDSKLYESIITAEPLTESILDSPEMGQCVRSRKTVPTTCLDHCQISGALVQKHLLTHSDVSARGALPEFTVVCNLSGKRLLQDEAEVSAVSGRPVQTSLLRRSALSGRKAEPDEFALCEFTGAEVFKSELATSDLSGKSYRFDEQRTSSISGLTGHKTEFVVCQETGHFLAMKEAEQCEVTGNYVRPGILQTCEVTHKRIVPSQLSKCAATGQRVLPTLLVASSLTGAQILETVAVRSATGKYCAPIEAKTCAWSGKRFHPDDLRVCALTGLSIHFEFVTGDRHSRLQALVELLDGIRRNAEETQSWRQVAAKASATLDSARCEVESAVLSPDAKHLAVCTEVRTLLGLRVRQAGFVYEIDSQSITGRVVQGRRSSDGWGEMRR